VFASLPPEIAQKAMIRPGDIVMTAAGATIGKMLFYDSQAPACYAGYLARFRPRADVNGIFVAYWMESQGYWDQIKTGKVVSTIENFSASKYQNLRLSVPPLDVQCAIADYLDSHTARIDALIDKKRRMAELADSRMRLRAYELTAANGRQVALRWLTRQVKTGTTPPADELSVLQDGAVCWYSPGDVSDWLDLTPASRTLAREALTSAWVPSFPAESTIVVGIGATAGRVAHLDHNASGNQQMTCIVAGPLLVPRFLSWQLFARSDELRATAPFTTLPILNNDFLKDVVMAVPALSQQLKVVRQLDQEARRVRQVSELIQTQLVRLVEYRHALITAAVTGKLDIPGVAA
jgi:type I restriction enzyme S subunit